ncbi:hypothetical protein TSUD_140620 [Trifolium subterraneum]|uniref:Nudix hydrolase domain-containing protein n=1 Tax=Trifolium subterraneum TaxID=3900 RepID=A0A2Z6NCK2_TRISU|nr:hypothetical protein TSUD_140620 [Trifolium subterraneum]
MSQNKTLLVLIFKDKQSEFLPFVIEGNVVGYIHNRFVEHLRGFSDVFVFPKDGGPFADCVSLHPLLKTADERTSAIGYVIEHLGEEHIPGIRNELYPVKSSFDKPVFFSLERAAAPYFGIKVYGIHMNGYVELDGEKHLWIGKRSHSKSTYPGMLDHLVAGGLPHGIDCQENVVKECEEEAGIPRAKPVGAVSYMDIDGYRYKRDVLFCYDLILPESFVPKNEGVPFKPILEFYSPFLWCRDHPLYISPENHGYLNLLRSLREGDCS